MATERFQSFTVAGHQLILNITPYRHNVYILTELAACQIVAQEVMSEQEMYTILELLNHYPAYAPYEALLAAISPQSIDQARAVVHEAIEDKMLDQELRGLRNILRRCRRILQSFHLDIRNLYQLGYTLVSRP